MPASKTVANDAIAPKDDVIKLFDGKTLGDTYTWLKDTSAKTRARCLLFPTE